MRRPSRSMDSLLFCLVLARSDGALYWCRLGSEAARSVSPYPGSENGNASDHSAPLPPPGPKKKGRPPKNKSKGAADVFTLSCMESLSCYLSAPGNDDGDALSNRKRVRCFCFCFFASIINDHLSTHKRCRSPVHHYPPRRKSRNRKCRVR